MEYWMNWRNSRSIGVVAALAVLLPGLAACGAGSADAGNAGKVTLSLVAYSTPQLAYEKIIKAYQATPEGQNVTFTKSFGASGDQSRAVEAGLKADIVAFSLEPDVTRLVKAGPEVITANPFTSGGARWNLLAGYGATSGKSKDSKAGLDYLGKLLKNVPVQDDSARKSLQTFLGGKGDAILAYENEAIFAKQSKQKLDYTLPDDTILIENPIAVTKNSAHPKEAKAFLKFLHSATAQKIFVENGYRPTTDGIPGADQFPTPSGLFTIEDLGGWSKVNEEFFDTEKGKVADIERKLGVSVEKK